jgi:hypothetical protein
MWEIDNRTPFAAERAWVRDRDGAEVWLVAVKCTFSIFGDGSTKVSQEQPPVLRVPEYRDEPGKSSLKYEADLVLTKTTTDITVVGHAYAPDGRPVTQLDVGFRVGPVEKILRVSGDRTWTERGISSPQAFTKMPLIYERAFGGVDRNSAHPDRDWEWRNPVGTGFAVTRDNLKGVALPNIEYPDERVTNWKDRPRPAGFGPIGAHWQPRARFAGTYDDVWMKDRQPLLPKDFDDKFFQCAPEDQQSPGFLRGGEPVTLRRLSLQEDVSFMLPRVFLGLETHFSSGAREVHSRPSLHSVILEPDLERISLVWHSALPCHNKVQKLERTILTMKPVVPLGQSSPDVDDEQDDFDDDEEDNADELETAG